MSASDAFNRSMLGIALNAETALQVPQCAASKPWPSDARAYPRLAFGVSENLCYTDAYARTVEASVVDTDRDAHAVLLDRRSSTPAAAASPPTRAC